MVFEGHSLNFPQKVFFKVIAEDIHGLDFVIETVLIELGVQAPPVKGNKSAAGKYVTYNVEILAVSLEHMNKIDAGLRNITGVKMVL